MSDQRSHNGGDTAHANGIGSAGICGPQHSGHPSQDAPTFDLDVPAGEEPSMRNPHSQDVYRGWSNNGSTDAAFLPTGVALSTSEAQNERPNLESMNSPTRQSSDGHAASVGRKIGEKSEAVADLQAGESAAEPFHDVDFASPDLKGHVARRNPPELHLEHSRPPKDLPNIPGRPEALLQDQSLSPDSPPLGLSRALPETAEYGGYLPSFPIRSLDFRSDTADGMPNHRTESPDPGDLSDFIPSSDDSDDFGSPSSESSSPHSLVSSHRQQARDGEDSSANTVMEAPPGEIQRLKAEIDRIRLTNLDLHQQILEQKVEFRRRANESSADSNFQLQRLKTEFNKTLQAFNITPRANVQPKWRVDADGIRTGPLYDDIPNIYRESAVEVLICRAAFKLMLGDAGAMVMIATKAIEVAEKLKFLPLTSRCHFVHGIGLYHLERFREAAEEFHLSFDCIDEYDIPNKLIWEWCHGCANKLGITLNLSVEFNEENLCRTTRTTRRFRDSAPAEKIWGTPAATGYQSRSTTATRNNSETTAGAGNRSRVAAPFASPSLFDELAALEGSRRASTVDSNPSEASYTASSPSSATAVGSNQDRRPSYNEYQESIDSVFGRGRSVTQNPSGLNSTASNPSGSSTTRPRHRATTALTAPPPRSEVPSEFDGVFGAHYLGRMAGKERDKFANDLRELRKLDEIVKGYDEKNKKERKRLELIKPMMPTEWKPPKGEGEDEDGGGDGGGGGAMGLAADWRR